MDFTKIADDLDVKPAIAELIENYHLFGEFNARKEAPNSPHADMTDIWVRYGDVSDMIESGDYSKIAEEHDSIWLKDLPEIKKLCFKIMSLVDGERLGGVLITKLPINGIIKEHSDSGWHAEYYDKFFVPIINEPGCIFGFNQGDILATAGEVWQFDNSKPHWVVNHSDCERIAMIVCIKHSKDFGE